MKITKYEHACLDIELDGKRLLIDPGVVTTSVSNYENIEAVLVTHMHADHLDEAKLVSIKAENPDVTIYAVQEVADSLQASLKVQIVSVGEDVITGPFSLKFTGGLHAVIHSSTPTIENVGVIVNSSFYYPGDSFTLPQVPIELLAVPISAPWLKISEAMDFITSMKPKRAFPVHDALLSEFGMTVSGTWLQKAAQSADTEYIVLKPGESLDV